MKFDFNLQMFADEGAESADSTSAADETVEETATEPESADEAGTETEGQQGEPQEEPIPEALSGVSEGIARDIMRKAREQEGAHAEQDGDNKLDATADPTKTKVPYERFYAKVEKERELQEQLDEYRKRYGDLNQQPAPQQPIQQQQVQQPQQQQPQVQQTQQQPFQVPKFSTEDFKLINDAIHVGAMQVSGMTQKDVDALEYLEDGDPRIAQWKQAQEFAKAQVYGFIQRSQQQQAEANRRFIAEHNRNMAAFAAYANEQGRAADFPQVREYATGEFFNALPVGEQEILAQAYNRIERNVASPSDTLLIRNYYEQAKAKFAERQAMQQQAAQPQVQEQKPKAQLPRSSNVHGSSGAGGGITEASLERMMREKPWHEIPQEYRDMLMGVSSRVTVRKE